MKKLLVSLSLVLILMAGCIYLPVPAPATAPQAGQPVVTEFAVNPAIVASGQNAVLSWVVMGAQTVSIDNGIGAVPLNGTTSILPSATTTYMLTAVNSAGASTAVVTVTVMGSLPVSQPGDRTSVLNIIPN